MFLPSLPYVLELVAPLFNFLFVPLHSSSSLQNNEDKSVKKRNVLKHPPTRDCHTSQIGSPKFSTLLSSSTHFSGTCEVFSSTNGSPNRVFCNPMESDGLRAFLCTSFSLGGSQSNHI